MKKLTSPQELERRLRLHFFVGFGTGGGLLSSLCVLGQGWDKGRLGPMDFLSVAFMCYLSWAIWDNTRQDLRQMAYIKTRESAPENSPANSTL